MISDLRIALAQFLQQRRAVHLRHHHVRHHEIDLAVVPLELLQRLDAIAGFDHRVAARGQAAGVERAQPLLVLDQQDGAVAGEIGRRGALHIVGRRDRAGHGGRRRFGKLRRLDVSAPGMWRGRKMRKIVPLPSSELDIDEAAGLLDDAVDRRQAEAGALADILGREERLENLVHDVGAMPVPVSFDLDQHVIAERQTLVLVAGAFVRGDVGGAQREPAAVRHGVACIDREIDDDLLELRRCRP